MTAVSRTKDILDALVDGIVPNDKVATIAKDFIQYDDSYGWSNEEIATEFLARLKARIRHQVKAGATRQAQLDNAAVVQAASDASVADL